MSSGEALEAGHALVWAARQDVHGEKIEGRDALQRIRNGEARQVVREAADD